MKVTQELRMVEQPREKVEQDRPDTGNKEVTQELRMVGLAREKVGNQTDQTQGKRRSPRN